jgi:predicted RNA-binding protein (TIGR00451 family)
VTDDCENHSGAAATPKSSTTILGRFSPDVFKLTEEVFSAETHLVLESLTKPVRTYYVRCNNSKISTAKLLGILQKRGLKVSRHPLVPEAIGIQVDGPFEIPPTKRSVMVDKHTAESVLQGANVYAPGILKCEAIRFGEDVTVLSELGDELATGKANMTANDILTFRKGLAIQVQHRRFAAPQVRELPEFSEGLLYPQSLAAMATTRALDPQEDETIIDMNCAPGGKLSHISELTQGTGQVLGFDRNTEKMRQTRQTLTRLGCSNVTLSIHDSRYLREDLPGLQSDRTLIDPPCSALGLRPKVYDFSTFEGVKNLADYQKQFLKAGSKITKPGGCIVYSVCTYTTQECERTVEFAERECGLSVVEQRPIIGSNGLARIASSAIKCQRFDPYVDEIGYFIAKFQC